MFPIQTKSTRTIVLDSRLFFDALQPVLRLFPAEAGLSRADSGLRLDRVPVASTGTRRIGRTPDLIGTFLPIRPRTVLPSTQTE